MASLNKIMIIGNIGQDPEMRFTPSGKPVTKFSVAVSNRFKRGTEWEEETQWFGVSAFGKLAEFCNQHLVKGQSVYVEGSIKLNEWGEGEAKKSNLQLTASVVKSLGKKVKETSEPDDEPF